VGVGQWNRGYPTRFGQRGQRGGNLDCARCFGHLGPGMEMVSGGEQLPGTFASPSGSDSRISCQFFADIYQDLAWTLSGLWVWVVVVGGNLFVKSCNFGKVFTMLSLRGGEVTLHFLFFSVLLFICYLIQERRWDTYLSLSLSSSMHEPTYNIECDGRVFFCFLCWVHLNYHSTNFET
jgi:hypothetical protein